MLDEAFRGVARKRNAMATGATNVAALIDGVEIDSSKAGSFNATGPTVGLVAIKLKPFNATGPTVGLVAIKALASHGGDPNLEYSFSFSPFGPLYLDCNG
jgi:hypothetical protein